VEDVELFVVDELVLVNDVELLDVDVLERSW
jgi:hypothetical protein